MDTNAKIAYGYKAKREYGYKYKDRICINIQRQNMDTNTQIEYGYKYIGRLWIHIQR